MSQLVSINHAAVHRLCTVREMSG